VELSSRLGANGIGDLEILSEDGGLVFGRGRPYRLCHAVHHVRLRNEPGDYLLIPPTAVGGATRVAGERRGDVGGLAANAVWITEIHSSSLKWVQRHPLEQSGQLDDLEILRSEPASAILHHGVAREDEFFPRPVRVPAHPIHA